MHVRRCAVLFVELDQEPRFEFSTLLQGGDGLDRTPRWLAYAPHLPAPLPVTLAQLGVFEKLPGLGRCCGCISILDVLHLHINLPLIQHIPHQPANQHHTHRK